ISTTLRVLPSFPTRRSSDLRFEFAEDAMLAAIERRSDLGDERRSRSQLRDVLQHDLLVQCRQVAKNLAIGLDDHDLALDFLLLRSEEHTSELQSRENLVCRL